MLNPTVTDVIAAKNRIENFITRTPLHRHLALEKIVGTEVHVKHENHQKLGCRVKVYGDITVKAAIAD